MKKIIAILFLFFLTFYAVGQQDIQYTQFMLNDYGLNPAIAGSNKGLFFMAGRRAQWQGFDYNPETNFVNFTKDIGKKSYRYFWHGVGASVENDRIGIFNTINATASYAIHLKIAHGYTMSFGIAAGVKQFSVSNAIFDVNDPALAVKGVNEVIIPILIPGFYLYSKKITLGISVRDLYKSELSQGKKNIGTNSKLLPTAYISMSRKFLSAEYDYTFIPAVNIQSNFKSIPSVALNFMTIYKRRIALGVSYRAQDAVSGIIQIRFSKHIIIGFAYDYTVSKLNAVNANATEIMVGYSPFMDAEDFKDKSKQSKCPAFDF
ncbi:MAG: PorP/SprF family type IX secretion system membrane protein [Bacteroidia bacterium]